MNATEIANAGIVTQLAVVHTMLPKVKELIDKQADEIKALHQILAYEGVGVSQEYLDECVAELRKTQDK